MTLDVAYLRIDARRYPNDSRLAALVGELSIRRRTRPVRRRLHGPARNGRRADAPLSVGLRSVSQRTGHGRVRLTVLTTVPGH